MRMSRQGASQAPALRRMPRVQSRPSSGGTTGSQGGHCRSCLLVLLEMQNADPGSTLGEFDLGAGIKPRTGGDSPCCGGNSPRDGCVVRAVTGGARAALWQGRFALRPRRLERTIVQEARGRHPSNGETGVRKPSSSLLGGWCFLCSGLPHAGAARRHGRRRRRRGSGCETPSPWNRGWRGRRARGCGRWWRAWSADPGEDGGDTHGRAAFLLVLAQEDPGTSLRGTSLRAPRSARLRPGKGARWR
jgi:hypothetical protein